MRCAGSLGNGTVFNLKRVNLEIENTVGRLRSELQLSPAREDCRVLGRRERCQSVGLGLLVESFRA
jgi:hypothetical protein